MLFLTNFLLVVGLMALLGAYAFGAGYLAEWAGDKWGDKGFNAALGVLLLLPIAIIVALGLTYGA